MIKVTESTAVFARAAQGGAYNARERKLLALLSYHPPGKHGDSTKKCCLPNMSHTRPLHHTSFLLDAGLDTCLNEQLSISLGDQCSDDSE